MVGIMILPYDVFAAVTLTNRLSRELDQARQMFAFVNGKRVYRTCPCVFSIGSSD